jgi:hypothetical protein
VEQALVRDLRVPRVVVAIDLTIVPRQKSCSRKRGFHGDMPMQASDSA